MIGVQHQIASRRLCPPQTYTEGLSAEKGRSVLCRHTSNSQDKSWEAIWERNKCLLFRLKQDDICCWTLGCDVIVMVSHLCPLWAARWGDAYQLEVLLGLWATPTHSTTRTSTQARVVMARYKNRSVAPLFFESIEVLGGATSTTCFYQQSEKKIEQIPAKVQGWTLN